MKNDRLEELKQVLLSIVGRKNVIFDERRTLPYRTGIRVGKGKACAVVFPRSLLNFWKVLETCIAFDKIIIVQAANTGLTGGSTPDGDDYDRDIVIINTLNLNQLALLRGGNQILAFPGTTLYQVEKSLSSLNRSPHSIIGSSCIGASVIGGVCNNSGGNLVNRGPAYTEYSLYARLDLEGRLGLVNHLGIALGDKPEEILTNLQNLNFETFNLTESNRLASDTSYHERVRDIGANTPARFNSDERRLYEASGCAGKLAVFAVRLDTFPKPKEEQVFFVGTNKPKRLTHLRKEILSKFKALPDMGEYMHRSYFDGADKYCKDSFLLIKYLGTEILPRLLFAKRVIDNLASSMPIIPDNISDKTLQFVSEIFPNHLPERIRDFRNRFEHYMLILASDTSIKETRKLLMNETSESREFDYIECTQLEGKDILLHRYVAGAAPARFKAINSDESGELLPLDIALPRNCETWNEILPREILCQMAESFQMGHFLCMVFHLDFVVKKGVDSDKLKIQILDALNRAGAKYPAEHNVGHLYKADNVLRRFYRKLDPTNTFNSGIGMTSKNKYYE